MVKHHAAARRLQMNVGAVLAVAAILTGGYATSHDVQTTADPTANLAGYRAYTFLETDPKAAGAITDAVAQRRIRGLLARQLNAKGYTQAASVQTADLGVHYSAQVVAKQSALMVGRPGPYSYGWGARQELDGSVTLDYRQGTLFVDLVDLAKGQLLWRARISEALSAGYSEDNWKKVDRALDEAFESLPPRR
jgi:hypothetical protein